MIAPDLTEEFPPVDPPAADAASPVDQPVEPAEQTVDELKAAYAKLQEDNAAMRARIAQLEAIPEERWVTLKKVARTPRPSDCEWLRRRCEAQKVEAEKRAGRWYVNENGPRLKACLNRR